MKRAIPEGCHAITPHITVANGDQAIEFYKRAFGAEELSRMAGPGGKGILHAELKIGDSVIFLADEVDGMGARAPQSVGGTTITLHLYVNDVDASFARALAAGAQVRMPVSDMFWGDRYGMLSDPFGHLWSLATHVEDVRPEEVRRRAERFFAKSAKTPA
jgi:PhnB protein